MSEETGVWFDLDISDDILCTRIKLKSKPKLIGNVKLPCRKCVWIVSGFRLVTVCLVVEPFVCVYIGRETLQNVYLKKKLQGSAILCYGVECEAFKVPCQFKAIGEVDWRG